MSLNLKSFEEMSNVENDTALKREKSLALILLSELPSLNEPVHSFHSYVTIICGF